VDGARLGCPRCAAPLASDGSLRCIGCGARHPVLGGVPCLLHDAAQARSRFAARFAELSRESAAQRAAIADELADAHHGGATRARLHAFADGVRISAATIAQLAARAGLVATGAADGDAIPSVAGYGALFDHYEYLFRDWGWGDAAAQEHELALARVAEAIGDAGAAPRVLVLGAGAGRLAYDLHHRLAAQTTLALDIQPLLVLAAQRMFAGETLVLAEFAANHLAAAHAVSDRKLHAPRVARAGLELAFADATRPPVQPGSFDIVVTPWFLDQLHCDVRDVLPAIHGALADGGRWVFFGPLLHPRGKPLARCFTADELLEQLPGAGFEPDACHREVMPYLRAPEGSARSEPVLTFAARKLDGDRWSLPAWLRGIELPIPRAAVPRRAADPVATAIATLVDGERSVLSIAGLLARRGGLDRRRALDATLAGLHALLRAAPQ
jgi:SAM-dependent methyltransferase